MLVAFVIAFALISSAEVAVPAQLSPHSAVVPLLFNTWPDEPACPAIRKLPCIFVELPDLPSVSAVEVKVPTDKLFELASIENAPIFKLFVAVPTQLASYAITHQPTP